MNTIPDILHVATPTTKFKPTQYFTSDLISATDLFSNIYSLIKMSDTTQSRKELGAQKVKEFFGEKHASELRDPAVSTALS